MNINTLSQTDHQRTIISLNSENDFSVAIRYEPLQHSLRVMHAGVQRLYFYEPDGFFPSKASLLNEYGWVVGRLQLRNSVKGVLQFDDTRISFVHNREQSSVLIYHPAFPEPLRWNYAAVNEAQLASKPDLFRALLLILALSVNVAALQVQPN
jgi:hypothetical protein